MSPDNVVRVGARVLRVPGGIDAFVRSDPARTAVVDTFVRTSPDGCLYHQPAYIDFARAENGVADMILLSRSGRPAVAIPIHPRDRWFLRSGYAGVLFPDTESETVLRASVGALMEFLEANPSVGYEAIQSAQANAYDNPARLAMIDSMIAGRGITKREMFSRMKRLDGEAGPSAPDSGVASPADLDNDLLGTYEGKRRSEIRQALRNGLQITYDRLGGDDEALTRAAYEKYLLIHETSWQRTGMQPHDGDHWVSLSRAVQRAGGRDLVVVARSPAGKPVATVTCHLFGKRALYWSGGSLEEGMALKANPVCLHAAMALCRRSGIMAFEIGRFEPAEPSEKERAITAYKTQFGGSIVRLMNFWQPPKAMSYVVRAAASQVVTAIRHRSPE